MHILDSDYIELESRRAAQLAALQWQTVTRLSKKELRRAQLKFVCKIYLIGFLYTFLVATQWWFLTELKSVQIFIIIYYYIIIAIIFVNFLILTLLQYVLRRETQPPKRVVIIYIIIMIEFGSVTISRPMVESDLGTFILASIFTIIMWIISFGLSTIGYTESDRSSVHLSLWSQKYYLATAISLLMTMEFSFIYVQISITLVMVFFLSIFFVVWGRVLGSLKFYKEESKYCNYYILLTFLNMISLLANCIIFIQRLVDVNDKEYT